MSWDDPSLEGVPAENAPFADGVWQPDAEAIAIKGGLIQFVGSTADAQDFVGEDTEVIDANNAVVVPGLIESHGHVQEIGEKAEAIDLRGVSAEGSIEVISKRAQEVPEGEWILGSGWDEGVFANGYPDMTALSKKVPNHPVVLNGLRGFGCMGNALAFEKAGIIKENIPVVISERQPSIQDVFHKKAIAFNAPIYFSEDKNTDNYQCDLSGNYQQKNIKAAVQCLDILHENEKWKKLLNSIPESLVLD